MAIHHAVIAVDFDGTVVTHAYPEIGEDAGAVPVLKELVENGCRLILYSMRHGKLLDQAVAWFREKGIPLYAVNENPEQKRWTSSPKVHADLRSARLLSPAIHRRRKTSRRRLGAHSRTARPRRIPRLTGGGRAAGEVRGGRKRDGGRRK